MKRNLYIAFLMTLFGLVAPYVHATWDVTTPAGSESKSLGDDRIRELKSDIQNALQYEGDFPGDDTSDPRFFYTPSTGTTSQRPTGSTNTAVGMLFINKSSGTIEQYNGSGWDVVATTIPLAGTITSAQISTEIAGAGLDGGGGVPLRVNVDSNTFTITNDTVTIKADSIGTSQLADAVSFTSVNSSSYTRSLFGILPIMQIQTAVTRTSTLTVTTGFVNTTLTVSITPKLSSSKVFVMASFTSRQNVGDAGQFTIARNGTNLASDSNGFMGTTSNNNYHTTMFSYDSPATTSATTYTVQFRTQGGGGSIELSPSIGGNVAESSIIAVEIAQ